MHFAGPHPWLSAAVGACCAHLLPAAPVPAPETGGGGAPAGQLTPRAQVGAEGGGGGGLGTRVATPPLSPRPVRPLAPNNTRRCPNRDELRNDITGGASRSSAASRRPVLQPHFTGVLCISSLHTARSREPRGTACCPPTHASLCPVCVTPPVARDLDLAALPVVRQVHLFSRCDNP